MFTRLWETPFTPDGRSSLADGGSARPPQPHESPSKSPSGRLLAESPRVADSLPYP